MRFLLTLYWSNDTRECTWHATRADAEAWGTRAITSYPADVTGWMITPAKVAA